MTVTTHNRISRIIATQIARLTGNGLSYDDATAVIYKDLNKNWPHMLTAYINGL